VKLVRIVTVPISFKHLIKGQAKFFASKGYDVLQLSADGPELQDVKQFEKVPHIIVPFTRQITPLKDLQCLWQLIKILRREKPDIVHTQTPKAGLLGMMAARICMVPFRLHTVGGMPLMVAGGGKRKLLVQIEKLTYSCAHKVLPNSTVLANWMVEQGMISRSKVEVLGHGSSNGIDTSHYDPGCIVKTKQELRNAYGIPSDAFVFVFIGRLVGDKGMNELAKAFGKITAKHPHAWLLLVGPWEQDLDPLPPQTIDWLQSNEKVVLTGYQSDVRPYFKASDALVFPSYREGFPNVVMQAGAMELPLIVTDINGCNEIVQEGENGLIIPSKDAEALEAAMLRLLEDQALYNSIQQRVRQTIVDRYEQQHVWQAIATEYEKGLGGQKQPTLADTA